MDNFDSFEVEELLGQRNIPGVTPDFIMAEIRENPIIEQHWKRNTEQMRQRFVEVMMKNPSNSDSPGFIYGFRTKQGYNPNAKKFEIKLGRTKRQIPQTRIF